MSEKRGGQLDKRNKSLRERADTQTPSPMGLRATHHGVFHCRLHREALRLQLVPLSGAL